MFNQELVNNMSTPIIIRKQGLIGLEPLFKEEFKKITDIQTLKRVLKLIPHNLQPQRFNH